MMTWKLYRIFERRKSSDENWEWHCKREHWQFHKLSAFEDILGHNDNINFNFSLKKSSDDNWKITYPQILAQQYNEQEPLMLEESNSSHLKGYRTSLMVHDRTSIIIIIISNFLSESFQENSRRSIEL